MRQPAGTIWAERAVMVLFLASLLGTLNLIMTVHRRSIAARDLGRPVLPATVSISPPEPDPPLARQVLPEPAVTPKVAVQPKASDPPRAPSPPPEDPTKKALAALAAATARELDEAERADRRSESLEKARQDAVAQSERWRRRELLVKRQVAALADRARKIDRQIDTLAAERDVLAQERDALKAAVAKSQPGKGSFAVLPYKGANGSWRRPIVLECADGTVTLRPKGPTFSLLDLSSMINPRSNPVILAIARELLRVQMSESPDGSPVVPYFVFLVRPDGIRAYYEIRARLEPLGIAFGYELVEQDLPIDVPDFDNLATWDGTIPLDEPLLAAPARNHGGGGNGSGDREGGVNGGGQEVGLAWPSAGSATGDGRGVTRGQLADGTGNGQGSGSEGREGAGESPIDFVWPSPSGARGSTGSGKARGQAGKPGRLNLAQGPRPGTSAIDGTETAGGTGTGTGIGDRTARGNGSGSFGTGSGGRDAGRPEAASATGAGTGAGSGGRSAGSSGSGGAGKAGQDTGTGTDPALAQWPFPYPPPGNTVADDPGGDGAPGLQPRSRPPARGAGSGSSGGEPGQGAGVALLPDLEPASDGLARSRSGTSGSLVDLAEPGINGGRSLPSVPSGSGHQPGTGTVSGSGLARADQAEAGQPGSSPDMTPSLPSTSLLPPGQGSDGGRPSRAAGSDSRGSGSSANAAAGDLTTGSGLTESTDAGGSSSGASSSASQKNAIAGTTGLNLGSMTAGASSPPGGASGLVFGSDAANSAANKSSSGSPDMSMFKSRIPDRPSKTIEVPFEIVVVCEPDGLVIHPGGYRVSRAVLETRRKDGILERELMGVAQQRAAADPTIRPQPRVKFLVESGGSPMFWAARKQILFSGLGWPMSLQVTGTQDPLLLGQRSW